MDIIVLDDQGAPVGPDAVGEVAIGSRYLSPGYWQQPELTHAAFGADADDAEMRVYRTRDVGRLRGDGCLEYLGRQGARVQIRGYRVEIAEVEMAVRSLEGVREAVVVAHDTPQMPTQLLAYLVPSATPAAQEYWRHALAEKLPDYMVPAAFVVMDALPMTPSGKVDRRALPSPDAQRVVAGTPYEAPRTDVERQLARLWDKLLNVERIGVHDDFFTIGGHSLLAMQLLTRVRATFHMDIPLAAFIAAPTVAALSQAIVEPGGQRVSRHLLPYKPYGRRPPLFCVHGVELLARHMDPDQPFYALYPHGMDGTRAPDTVEEMAAEYLDAILACQCEGPYYLSGYSFGGLVALEMAHQLLDRGHEVALLVLLDSGGPDTVRAGQRTFLGIGADAARRLLARLCNLFLRPGRYLPLRLRLSYFLGVSRGASHRYAPRRYPGHIHILHAADNPRTPQLRWAGMSTAGLTVDEVPGHHTSMLAEPHVQRVAAQLSHVLQAAQKRRSTPALLAAPGLAAEPTI
jgi:thioesterase domain-containing protein/aryl carrier-like protein